MYVCAPQLKTDKKLFFQCLEILLTSYENIFTMLWKRLNNKLVQFSVNRDITSSFCVIKHFCDINLLTYRAWVI